MSIRLISLAVLLTTLAACDTAEREVMGAADGSDSATVSRIAGDKRLVADLIRTSVERGTFDDALAIAMEDSAVQALVVRTATESGALLTTQTGSDSAPKKVAAVQTGTKSGSNTARRSTRSGGGSTTTERRGDVLDQAERTAQRANERLEQAERVRRQAEEAKRKVDIIIGR